MSLAFEILQIKVYLLHFWIEPYSRILSLRYSQVNIKHEFVNFFLAYFGLFYVTKLQFIYELNNMKTESCMSFCLYSNQNVYS